MASYAFLLGANGPNQGNGKDRVSSLPQVKFAESDCERLADALRHEQIGYEVEVHIPPNEEEAWIAPQRALSCFNSICRISTEADTVLFYFSGHGVLRGSELYLLLGNSTWDNLLVDGLSFSAIQSCLLESEARSKIVVLDCCHAGAALSNEMGAKGAAAKGELVADKMTYDQFLVSSRTTSAASMVACGKNKQAREDEAFGGGVFTGLLIDAMTLDLDVSVDAKSGFITPDSLRSYLSSRIYELNHSRGDPEKIELPSIESAGLSYIRISRHRYIDVPSQKILEHIDVVREFYASYPDDAEVDYRALQRKVSRLSGYARNLKTEIVFGVIFDKLHSEKLVRDERSALVTVLSDTLRVRNIFEYFVDLLELSLTLDISQIRGNSAWRLYQSIEKNLQFHRHSRSFTEDVRDLVTRALKYGAAKYDSPAGQRFPGGGILVVEKIGMAAKLLGGDQPNESVFSAEQIEEWRQTKLKKKEPAIHKELDTDI